MDFDAPGNCFAELVLVDVFGAGGGAGLPFGGVGGRPVDVMISDFDSETSRSLRNIIRRPLRRL